MISYHTGIATSGQAIIGYESNKVFMHRFSLLLTEIYKRLRDTNKLHLVIHPSVKMHDL